MRTDQARAVAERWVVEADFGPLPVVGAFVAGSTVEARPDDELPLGSDVDLVVVVEGEAPAKPGKLRHAGVLLEVTYLPWADLADADVVARTHYLAPSFARDTVITDPSGRLRRLQRQVAGQYARPDVVRDRCEGVLARMAAGAPPSGSWAEAVTGWLFPTSLASVVVLVAARRNPTVRLRYLRAREVLTACGARSTYAQLLASLGCAGASVDLVRRHLAAMTAAFDAAAAAGPTDFFFASDISPAAREVAVDATAALVDQGDHREAVFWLVATFSRAVQILTVEGSGAAAAHERAFADAAADLLGVRTQADLDRRRAALTGELASLRTVADAIIDRDLPSG